MVIPFYTLFLACVAYSCVQTTHTMVYDNRFFPLYHQPPFVSYTCPSHVSVRGLFLGATQSLSSCIEESLQESDELPLFRIYGHYNQVEIDRALHKTHENYFSSFRSDMNINNSNSGNLLPWIPHGKLNFKGIAGEFFISLSDFFGVGGSFLGGKISSHLELEPSCPPSAPGDRHEIFAINKHMHDVMHLCAPCYSKSTFGDLDIYVKFHYARPYWHKFRFIDLGVNVGFLIPTARATDQFNPASVPLGGNKHFGMYAAFEGTFVLREDISTGLLLRVNKRLARTSMQRAPFMTEPTNYGVIVAPVKINPGATIACAPWVQFDNLRRGLGVHIAYTLVHHWHDHWRDLRPHSTVPINREVVEERSVWGSDYLTVHAFYNFGYDQDDIPSHQPLLSFAIDIPIKGAVAKRIPKTNGLSIRIEYNL